MSERMIRVGFWGYWLKPFKYFPANPFSKEIAQQVTITVPRGKKRYLLLTRRTP